MPQENDMFRRYATIVCFLAAGAAVVYAAPHAVGQKGRLFSPGAIHVKTGETVTFKNDDSVTHHIYSSTKGHEFDLETTRPGQGVTRTFSNRGRVEVRCGLHPGMRLVVTVK
jgi:plastocyanin